MTLRLATLAFAALIALTAACGNDDDDGPPDGTPGDGSPAEVQLTDADDGATVQIARDGTLIIALTSNPRTGFRWFVAEPAPA